MADVTNYTLNSSDPDPASAFGPRRDSLFIVIPITVLYCAIFVSGLFGNVCTCIVITRNKNMHTATNYYLFSLAVSDLLLLVCGLPQEIYYVWSRWPYVFGESFCVLRGLAAETSTNASVLTITSFTIERYVAICHPFLSHTMSKLSRAVKNICFVWVISFALALPQALQFGLREQRGVVMCLQTKVIIAHSFEISTFVFFLAPMVLITALYALIGLRLSRSRMKRGGAEVRKHQSTASVPGDATKAAAAVCALGPESLSGRSVGSVHRKHSQSTRRVVKMLVAVVIAFFLCWAPFHAQRLVAIYGTSADHQARSPAILMLYGVLTYCSGVLYFLSTAINPVLYHIMSNKFREAFKSWLTECWGGGGGRGRGRGRSTRARAYSPMLVRRNTALSITDNSGNSLREETSRISQCTLKRPSSTRSVLSRSSTLDSRACTAPGDRPRAQRHGTPATNPQGPTDKINALEGTISNSSLRAVKMSDIEDELGSYLEEIKRRPSFVE